MIHPEITMFKEVHKVELTIGLEVTISPDCQYYEPQYDAGMKYMVTGLCVDVDGLNISLSDSVHESQPMHNRFLQEVDGYRWGDIDPITKAVRSEDARDAARYRWLRDGAYSWDASFPLEYPDSLDEIVDAAISAQEPKG